MDTTSNVVNNDAILCPTDGRRSSKEVWMKLFVVHLTTVAGFCHILSVRREPIISWKLVLYILVPYSVFAYHALYILVIIIGFGILLVQNYRGRPTEAIKESLWRAPRWLFGRVPDEEDAGYQRLSTAWRRGRQPQERQTKWKKVGRILLACPFLAQCIGTIYLYHRRRSHDAVTLADQKVFELGCTGILTAAFWLADTLELPPFSLSAPFPQKATTLIDKACIFLRDCRAKVLNPGGFYGRTFSLFKNGAVGLVTFAAQHDLSIFQEIIPVLSGEDSRNGPGDRDFSFSLFGFALVLGGILSFYFIEDFCTKPKDLRDNYGSSWWYLCWPLVAAVYWLPILLFLGFIIVIRKSQMAWEDLAEQIHKLDAWPQNASCPLLWSDPAANSIWALA